MTGELHDRLYPLGEHASTNIKTAGGRPLEDINMGTVLDGDISTEDLRIHGNTLRTQAEIARQAGFDRLAENLIRAPSWL